MDIFDIEKVITIIKIISFVLVTIALIYLSRKSLRNWRLHGFYRFFAWEAIIVLILFNIDSWFIKPFSAYQIVSWVLLSLSLLFTIYSIYDLYCKGKPDRHRDQEGLIGIEKTSKLVTTGSYRYIRHPMYSSLVWLAWGTFFKSPSWFELVLSAVATVFLILTAKFEERENLNFFGETYRDYIKQTKMFIPHIF